MKYILSRYNHDISWLKDYTDDYVIYDRSEIPVKEAIVMPNIGSDIYDKLTYIIDNYDNLPDIAIYTKANIFKYISKGEFDLIKDNKTFTPILTQNHPVREGVSYYKDGMYYEINNSDYIKMHPTRHFNLFPDFAKAIGIDSPKYLPFAPGSNYIIPRENILKHSRDFYVKLRSYLMAEGYPGEAMFLERSLYLLWK